MRVIVDTAELRRPHAGKARWINGLIGALDGTPNLELIRAPGLSRIGGGLLFRPVNVARQRWWYDWGLRRQASRLGADALLMPGAYSCSKGKIPQLVSILDVNYLTRPGMYDAAFERYARQHLEDRLAGRNPDLRSPP